MSSYQGSAAPGVDPRAIGPGPMPAADGTAPEVVPRYPHEIEEAIVDIDDEEELDTPSTEAEEIDPNEFDLMLSRSLQSGGSILEPESVEHSMLRGSRRYSRSGITSRTLSRASTLTGRGTRG